MKQAYCVLTFSFFALNAFSQKLDFTDTLYKQFERSIIHLIEHDADVLYPEDSLTTRFLFFKVNPVKGEISLLFIYDDNGVRDTNLEKRNYKQIPALWVKKIGKVNIDTNTLFVLPIQFFDPEKSSFRNQPLKLPIGYNQHLLFGEAYQMILLPRFLSQLRMRK